MNSFHSSVSFDKRLFRHDINGSIAHVKMLGKQKIISSGDAETIVNALKTVLKDIENGALDIDSTAEDIHSFIENVLISRIGETGKRMHTGRSRNDQVALDMRMYVKEEIGKIKELIADLMKILLDLAKKHVRTVMPGFTHLQKAQPIILAHHLLSYFQMFRRDTERLDDCLRRTDEMPLGSGALAGSPYPLDREYVRKELGFSKITENSIDAVSDRDFCIEFLSSLSIIMMHLSRFCEELILWSTDAFGFAEISDAYATGSSIMPQKKNPDAAELIRGKSGRVFGSLIGLLTVMKGLPLAYNKDMQEDKEAVFGSADTVKACLSVFCGMLAGISFNEERMCESAKGGHTNATDAADWLVKKGMAFREAHEIIGKVVVYALDKKVRIDELTLKELKKFSDLFDDTFFDAISAEACVNARNVDGGPAASAVAKAIDKAEKYLNGQKK